MFSSDYLESYHDVFKGNAVQFKQSSAEFLKWLKVDVYDPDDSPKDWGLEFLGFANPNQLLKLLRLIESARTVMETLAKNASLFHEHQASSERLQSKKEEKELLSECVDEQDEDQGDEYGFKRLFRTDLLDSKILTKDHEKLIQGIEKETALQKAINCCHRDLASAGKKGAIPVTMAYDQMLRLYMLYFEQLEQCLLGRQKKTLECQFFSTPGKLLGKLCAQLKLMIASCKVLYQAQEKFVQKAATVYPNECAFLKSQEPWNRTKLYAMSEIDVKSFAGSGTPEEQNLEIYMLLIILMSDPDVSKEIKQNQAYNNLEQTSLLPDLIASKILAAERGLSIPMCDDYLLQCSVDRLDEKHKQTPSIKFGK